MSNAYDFSFTSIDGEPLPLSTFKGKPVLVVNVASRCGLTPQYTGLEQLQERYGERGLTVLGCRATSSANRSRAARRRSRRSARPPTASASR